jgi:hypothetical protein
MKKLLAVVAALAAGAFVFTKVRSSRNDDDLWRDATSAN